MLYYNPYFMYVHYYPLPIASRQLYSQPIKQLAPYPPVNPQKFSNSAQKINNVMQQAQLLLDKIKNSTPFAHDLMDAAQRSDKEKVNQLIKSVGITNTFETKYTPGQIQIILTEKGCCGLTVLLHW